MNKKPLTQSQYERVESKLKNLRLKLKERKINNEDAIDFLITNLHYGKERATIIVKEWTRHFCNSLNTRHYNPNPVVKMSSSKEPRKAETDLGIEREMI